MTDLIIIVLLALILFGNSRFGTMAMNRMIDQYKQFKRSRHGNKK